MGWLPFIALCLLAGYFIRLGFRVQAARRWPESKPRAYWCSVCQATFITQETLGMHHLAQHEERLGPLHEHLRNHDLKRPKRRRTHLKLVKR